MSILTFSQTVDIGGGRGRLAPEHAASLRRVDAEVRALVGRDLDVNSAWRDPEVQQKLRDAYLHYLKYGAPWAPIALTPDSSVHCKGGAIDTDDYRDARIVKILNRHGWFHTVYRWVNGKRTLVEPWHFERDRNRDQHRNDPAPAQVDSKPIPAPEPEEEEDNMKMMGYKNPADGRVWYAEFDTSSGFFHPWVSSDKDYIRSIADKWTPAGIPLVTEKHWNGIKAECEKRGPEALAKALAAVLAPLLSGAGS